MTLSEKLELAIIQEKAAKAEMAKRSFEFFVKEAWPILEPNTPYRPGIHHKAICAHLQAVAEGKITRLIINSPPRGGKSLLVSVLYPAWVWIRNPSARFLCTSFKFDLAADLSEKAQKVVNSEWYQENWGDIVELDKQTIEVFTTKASGSRRCASFSGCMGFGASGQGSAVIIDDPHSISEVMSDDVRRKDLEVYDTGLSNRVSNGAAIIIVMQRLHDADLTGHILSKNFGFEHLLLPNEFEILRAKSTSIWTDPRTEEGQLLWPDMCDAKMTDELKRSHGVFAYTGQFQQAPVSKSGGLLNPGWFKTWSKSTLPETFDSYVISSDFTFKNLATSDYVVMQAWGRKGANYFLLDQVRGQWDFVQTKDQFVKFVNRWPQITTKLLEDSANGPAILSSLRDSISGIIAIKSKDSKVARLSAVSPMIESGNVYIPEDASWKEAFLHEMAMFPKGVHDDMVDALSQALIRLEKTRTTGIIYIQHEII